MIKKHNLFLGIALVVYAVLLFIFLTLYRLPVGKIITGTLKDLSGGSVLIQADRISCAFPFHYKMEDVHYGIRLGNVVAMERLKRFAFRPAYPRLFLGYMPLTFQCSPTSGHIRGTIGISMINGTQKGFFSIQGNDLSLEENGIIRTLIKRQLKGTLEGEGSFQGDLTNPLKLKGNGRLVVRNGSIETKIDIAGLQAVPFDMIRLAFSINNGIMSLKQVKMDGPMFSGQYGGEITLNREIKQSRFKINGEMKPGPLLDNNELAQGFLSRIMQGNRPIQFEIHGTFQRPSISWKRSG